MNQFVTPPLSEFFNSAYDPNIVFGSERGIRENPHLFSHYCRGFLEEDDLPISMIAFDLHERINEGIVRKDKKTPAKQHEQSIMRTLTAGLDACEGSMPYGQVNYFSKDILLTVAILHDVLENHKDKFENAKSLSNLLGGEINGISGLTPKARNGLLLDVASAVIAVKTLTRNGNSRNSYNAGLLENPASAVVKMPDWINKLATMVGVGAFEKDDQAGMKRALTETELLFINEFQGFITKAKQKYPELTETFDLFDDYMACIYHPLKGYAYYATEPKSGNPISSLPYDFSGITQRPQKLLRLLPSGLNWARTSFERMAENPYGYERIPDYCKHLIEPALRPLLDLRPNQSLRTLPNAPACAPNTP